MRKRTHEVNQPSLEVQSGLLTVKTLLHPGNLRYPLQGYHAKKERIVFQASFFRGELFNFAGVVKVLGPFLKLINLGREK